MRRHLPLSLLAGVLPVIATSEMKGSLPGAQAAHGGKP